MKNYDWKHVTELVGISAIVASLIFVGFQLRLEDRVAISELSQSEAASRAELAVGMSDHAETWEKANRGENLTPAEEFVLKSYVDAWFRRALMSTNSGRSIRGSGGDVSRMIFSIWLYNNPGARRIWNSQRAEEFALIQHLNPDVIFINDFANEIRSDLASLDSIAD